MRDESVSSDGVRTEGVEVANGKHFIGAVCQIGSLTGHVHISGVNRLGNSNDALSESSSSITGGGSIGAVVEGLVEDYSPSNDGIITREREFIQSLVLEDVTIGVYGPIAHITRMPHRIRRASVVFAR